jgi:Secretion system C-terminal sorting domain
MFSVSTLQNFKDSAEFELLGRIEEIKQDLKYPLEPAKWSAEVLRNTILTPNEQIDALYKEVFGIALTDKFLYDGVFSAAQITRLKQIAKQCPFEKGNAVYSARVLLAHVEVPYVNYYNDCEGGIKPNMSSTRKASQNNSLSIEQIENKINNNYELIPNPNNGTFKVSLPNGDGYQIVILDATGKLIEEHKNINTQFIHSSSLKVGLYLCKVIQDGEVVFISKFVVI